MWYPANEVTANPNVSQKNDLTVKVFWTIIQIVVFQLTIKNKKNESTFK